MKNLIFLRLNYSKNLSPFFLGGVIDCLNEEGAFVGRPGTYAWGRYVHTFLAEASR